MRLGRTFSFRGRLRRTGFWLGTAAAVAIFVLLYVGVEKVAGRGATLVLYVPFFWAMAAQMARRLHDRDKSAAWLLLLLIPILGPLWTAFDLGLRRGTRGENRYGDDPRASRAEYARVA